MIPEIEYSANEILSHISNFTIKIKDEESKLKIYISKKGEKDNPARDGCGFERAMVNLSVRASICKMSMVSGPDVLVIDEIFTSLDSTNRNTIRGIIEYLKTIFGKILVISHIDDVKNLMDKIVSFEKDEFGHNRVNNTNINNILPKDFSVEIKDLFNPNIKKGIVYKTKSGKLYTKNNIKKNPKNKVISRKVKVI
jgi:exonuclease SbcC